MHLISAIRFGEISPRWQNVKSLEQYLEGQFSYRQNFEPTLAKNMPLGHFYSCKWPNIKIAISYLVTMDLTVTELGALKPIFLRIFYASGDP